MNNVFLGCCIGVIEVDNLSISNAATKPQIESEKVQTSLPNNATANDTNTNVHSQVKPSKREGNQQGHDITGMQAAKQTWSPPTQATTKPSRRTTSLLNLFMSNPPGM